MKTSKTLSLIALAMLTVSVYAQPTTAFNWVKHVGPGDAKAHIRVKAQYYDGSDYEVSLIPGMPSNLSPLRKAYVDPYGAFGQFKVTTDLFGHSFTAVNLGARGRTCADIQTRQYVGQNLHQSDSHGGENAARVWFQACNIWFHDHTTNSSVSWEHTEFVDIKGYDIEYNVGPVTIEARAGIFVAISPSFSASTSAQGLNGSANLGMDIGIGPSFAAGLDVLGASLGVELNAWFCEAGIDFDVAASPQGESAELTLSAEAISLFLEFVVDVWGVRYRETILDWSLASWRKVFDV